MIPKSGRRFSDEIMFRPDLRPRHLPRPVEPNRTAPVHHLPTPLFRSLALGVAILASTLIAARSASAEATLIVEADSGKVLHAEHATYPWYPASTTKLMTMYLTLKAVKDKRLTLDTPLPVSTNAVAQAPSKMGFNTGTVVTVDNALKMMMVKSANDISVVLAEGVSGSIEKFADDMNAASRRLGMTQSSWVNPNGLPADEQITSARDMAILARAILRELPEYEMYWHIPAIKFGRRVMRNTNGLLGRYAEADGMKTGFICASGFNVVASATRNGRKLIVVVFGARSGVTRSEKAAQLFEKGFASGGLSWLMPSLGSVDALQPIAAAPPNLREEMCGKNRRRPAAEEADDDETQQTNSDVDQSSAFATTLQNLNGRAKTGPVLGPYTITAAPMPVWAGTSRNRATEDVEVASIRRGKKKKATAVAAKDAAETKNAETKSTETKSAESKSAKRKLSPKDLPATANASVTGGRGKSGTFTPASAKDKPVAAPGKKDGDAPSKKKTATAKPAAKQKPADAKQ
jgi:D-alanyl-D-alanine carboxypeptidase